MSYLWLSSYGVKNIFTYFSHFTGPSYTTLYYTMQSTLLYTHSLTRGGKLCEIQRVNDNMRMESMTFLVLKEQG